MENKNITDFDTRKDIVYTKIVNKFSFLWKGELEVEGTHTTFDESIGGDWREEVEIEYDGPQLTGDEEQEIEEYVKNQIAN